MTTPDRQLTEALRGIGLTTNEAAVYLTCLELGPASIWDIAQKSGVKRTSCYVILDELLLKGYAAHTTDGRRTIYSVTSPSQLWQAVERRHDRFTTSLSRLEALASKAASKPNLEMYEGSEGIREAYALSLAQPRGGEILTHGTADVEISYPELIADYLTRRVERKISVRAILPDSEINRKVTLRDAKELRMTRFLPPESYPQNTEMNCFGETICYIAHSERTPFATVLRSATLAAEERARFELIWKLAVI